MMAQDRIIQLAVEEIVPDPAQPRKTFPEEELRGLGQTLAHKQIDPIHVRKVGSRYQIVHGQRRWMAAKLVGLKTIAGIVEDGPFDGATVLEEQLISNIQREDLTSIDTARGIDRLIRETGRPASAVAARLGKSPSQVSKLLTLLLLSQDVQEQVASGKLAASTAYEIAKVSDTGERNRLAAQAANGGLTRDKAAALTRALAKSAKPRPHRHRDRVVFPLGDGRSLAVSGAGLNLDWLLTSIEHLLRRLRDASAGGLALPDVIKSLSGK